MYQFIISYPFADYPSLDSEIQGLAVKFGGNEIGSGVGMGQRDLVFAFKVIDRLTTDFIIEVLKLPETEVSIISIES